MPKKAKKKPKDVDWSDEANFDKNRSIIYIEHSLECPIFSIKADEFLHYLQSQFPERQFILIRNQNGKLQPRDGSFEIELSQNARTSKHNLWSGLDKGPPRRDKFPVFEMLMAEVQKILKKIYAEVKKVVEEDEEENQADVD